MRARRWLKSCLFALLTVGLTVAVGLIALEISLRAIGVSEFFFQMDPDVSVIHIPGKSGKFVFADGHQFVTINSHGYRDAERIVAKPVNTYRIVLLGDSFVEALQVPQTDTLTAVLERRLGGECGLDGQRYEVLNFGVSGFGTAQELETLRHRASPFDPDLVLLMFYASNDLFDNTRELDVEPNRLHYELTADGRLVKLPFSINDNPMKRWLRHHSRAYSFLRERVGRVAALRRALTAIALVQQQADPTEINQRRADRILSNVQFLRDVPEVIERAWRLAAALILEIARLSEDQGARFGVVSIPNRDEIRSYSTGRASSDPKWDYQQSQRRLDLICAEHDIRCLNLVATFGKEAADEYYFPQDGHWTVPGHRAVAGEILKWIRTFIPGCRPATLPAIASVAAPGH